MNEFLYSVEREYNVPMESMWQAWVDPAALDIWYSPTELKTIPGATTSDAVVGGVWSVGVDVPQYNHRAFFFGKYSKVEPGKQLVHSMHYVESQAEFDARDYNSPAHEVIIDFEDRGDKTWVRFSQYGQLPEGQAPQAKAGMESYFDNLGIYLGR